MTSVLYIEKKCPWHVTESEQLINSTFVHLHARAYKIISVKLLIFPDHE